MFGVRIDWIKPFSFLLDPKVMEQVNNLPENNKRREIPPPEKFKSMMQVTRESNPQPAVLETAALPIELVTYHIKIIRHAANQSRILFNNTR